MSIIIDKVIYLHQYVASISMDTNHCVQSKSKQRFTIMLGNMYLYKIDIGVHIYENILMLRLKLALFNLFLLNCMYIFSIEKD
jgi:hypothetical protein